MKNKKAEHLWQNLISNNVFLGMVKIYRQKHKIPVDGFKGEEESKVWTEKLFKNRELALSSIRDLRNIKQHNWGVDITGLDHVISEYIKYGAVSNFTLLNSNTTGCDLFFTSRDNFLKKLNQLEEGYVYIKISPLTRPTDVKTFLGQQLIWINILQRILINEYSLEPKVTKFKTKKHIERDYLICELNTLDSKELKELTKCVARVPKDVLISNIMKHKGYKVSPEGVRKVLETERKSNVKNKQLV